MSKAVRVSSVIVSIALVIACNGPVDVVTADAIESQIDIVKRLTGETEISPGIRLQDRWSADRRAIVRDFLAATLQSSGLVPLRQTYSDSGENVYTLLPASVPSDEYVVLGAHFDTVERSPGASDNATGCALVLEIAKNLVTLPERRRNIYAVLFDEEEGGPLGAEAFAQMLQQDRVNVVAVHTADQVGWDSDGDGAIELEIPYSGALELYREAALNSGFTSEIHTTSEAGSDHSAFRALGMPSVGISEEYRNGDTSPHWHRPTDTWNTVDFEYLAAVTGLVHSAMNILVGQQ